MKFVLRLLLKQTPAVCWLNGLVLTVKEKSDMEGALNSNNNANNNRENCFLSEYCRMALTYALYYFEKIYATKIPVVF